MNLMNLSSNMLNFHFLGEASKQIHDYKFKLQKAEQDIATLEGMVSCYSYLLK